MFAFALFLVFILSFAGCCVGASWLDCRIVGRRAMLETRFGLGGCYVKYRGQWSPVDNWRVQ
jgi:hypothetical protein